MRKQSSPIIVALTALVAILSISSFAHGADSRQPVFDALTKVVTTPSHRYTTSSAVNGGKPTEGETIFANFATMCPGASGHGSQRSGRLVRTTHRRVAV